MTRIKLPLRVRSSGIYDANDKIICCGFADIKTAQLFADCFTGFALPLDGQMPVEFYNDVSKRAAEAVKE